MLCVFKSSEIVLTKTKIELLIETISEEKNGKTIFVLIKYQK